MTERDPIDLSLRARDAARDADERAAIEQSLAAAVFAVRRTRAARCRRNAQVAVASLAIVAAVIAWQRPELIPRATAPLGPYAEEDRKPPSPAAPRIVRLDDNALLAELAAARIDATLRCAPGLAGGCELTLLAGGR